MTKTIELNFKDVTGNLPKEEANSIYVLKRRDSICYIGKTTQSVEERMREHKESEDLSMRDGDKLFVATVDDSKSLEKVEGILIYENKPELNEKGKDCKPNYYDDYAIEVSDCDGLKGKK